MGGGLFPALSRFYSSPLWLADGVLEVALRSAMVRRLIWNLVPASVLVGALWIALAGENGLLERSTLQQRLIATEARVSHVEDGNRTLEADIRALKTAPQIRRRVAAESLLRAEEGSVIYRFD